MLKTAADHVAHTEPACSDSHVGRGADRVDGQAKVTGAARYSAEFTTSGLVHGCVLNSPIATGRVLHIDAAAALDLPGVLAVFTHENRP
ncbi:MAG TPA: xanthine dehydrogenase family protein molybdopterin-binding subunit, partial [Advenella sp.]|nr:xanthine dehydrogenase family protein molybdopterin-binding subunit [Advenella sp.]